MLHGFPSSVQDVPAATLSSAGQSGPFPGQFSVRSHSPADGRQTVRLGSKTSAGQSSVEPSQNSASSQIPAAGRHVVVFGFFASAGHVVLVPVQVSASSQTPAAARQVAPALPAGCWQASEVPLHSSLLHGLPSSVHAVPLGTFASAGQFALEPVQFSVASHSSTEARQTVVDDLNESTGHVVLVPVQTSATSQTPADGRHVVPALPAGWVQALLDPSHTSVLHGLPSSVQVVPAGTLSSVGHAALDPVQFSVRSHSPPDARQIVVLGSNPSAGHAPLVPVQLSATSQMPATGRHTVVLGWKTSTHELLVPVQWSAASSSHPPPCELPVQLVDDEAKTSAGQLPLVPVQVSSTSHWPADGRHTVLLDSKTSTHVSLVPVQ